MRNLRTLLSLLLLLLTVSGTAWGQTVTATLQMNAEAMSQPDVWLVGFDRGDSPAPAVFLRWVQVPSVFLPLWELQLAALPGILDPTVVTGESGGYEFITLPAGFSPRRGDEYVAQISFTPDGPRVAVSMENTSRAGERYSVQVPLRQWVELSTPWPADRVREEYPHIQTMRIGLDWTPLGLPLSMQQGFRWRWVEVSRGVRDHVGYQFWHVEAPALAVQWPDEPMPGYVEFTLVQDGREWQSVRTAWSPDEQILPLDLDLLPYGDAELKVRYVVGEDVMAMPDGRLRVLTSRVVARYRFAGSDPVQGVTFEATLRTEAAVGALPLALDVRYRPLGGTWAAVYPEPPVVSVHLGPDEPAVFQYTVAVPPGEGELSVMLRAPDSVEFLDAGDTFHVAPVPPLVLRPVHPHLEPKEGEAAIVLPGEPMPQIGVYSVTGGTLGGELLRNGAAVRVLEAVRIPAGQEVRIELGDTAEQIGIYEARLRFETEDGRLVHHAFHFAVLPSRDEVPGTTRLVFTGEDGKLAYVPDYLGNRLPDFSRAGYMGGGVALPDVPVVIEVEPDEGDDWERIQKAVDYVASLPVGPDGLRGAVLLRGGVYEVSRPIVIDTGGIVVRGEGTGEDGTLLIATGREQYNVFEVGGPAAIRTAENSSRPITDLYVPVGARSFHVAHTDGLSVGDTIIVRRMGNAAWIQEIGMDRIAPRPDDPGSTVQWTPFHLDFERVITAIDGNRITVDAPIFNAIDARWGGGSVIPAEDVRISQVGIENLRAESAYDPDVTCLLQLQPYPCDEEHAVNLVRMDNVKDAWVRDVVARHFFHGVVELGRGSKHVTVQDAASLEPVSVLTGSRRYPFHILGQLNLVQRAYSEGARHAFAVSSRVPGPNVFLYSASDNDFADSEPHHRWSVGGLYDNVRSPIAFQDRQYLGTGHGWAGAYYVAWNTEGSLVAQKPPTAQNWAIGHVGERRPGAFQPREDGWWESYGVHVTPESLYLRQLADRLGVEAARAIGYDVE